jgi:hypothetical protein
MAVTGRPKVELVVNEVERAELKLVIKLAQPNLRWGYTKSRDAPRTGLKVGVWRTTVVNILGDPGIGPNPEREKMLTWKRFPKIHWEMPYACDFFGIEVLGIFGTIRSMVFPWPFFLTEGKTRAVQTAGIVLTHTISLAEVADGAAGG